jgi:hypothetical protein
MSIGLGYRPGVLSSAAGGGGGGPLGEATVWPSVSSWGDLASISSPRDGDQALVIDPATLSGVMLAQWNADQSQWEFSLGEFFIFDAMFAFPHPIQDNASAIFQGRSFLWTYLQGPDLTDQYRWLPNDVAQGSVFLRGYAIGDESSEAQLLTQGLVKFENSGTFATSFLTDGGGPFVRMDTYSNGASGGFYAAGSDVESTTRIYQRLVARAKSPVDGNWNLPFFAHQQSPTGRTVRWATKNATSLLPVSNTLSTLGATASLSNGGATFGVTFKTYEFIDEGQSAGCRVYIDGLFYGQYNRTGGTNKSFIADGAHYGISTFRGAADNGIGMDFKDLIMMEF